ncbi:hypothetical protein J2855_004440 [Agrobacterium tumefaciens]|jgi:hypothetical protein|nr:hypothetical protein At12D1_43350 [Agrobacterium tumefaciens]MBP2510785.1 hypothetical protein [Agrobacterium tumefaciens]MBP2520016.1 hypothetical protein [Agrobacterium tumefaciens]MBP2573361.1 hypothetical protein [Agrobacterium tumefaciens]MBP2578686.1 hypothetical protein [Agrobacterium tumefaciens]
MLALNRIGSMTPEMFGRFSETTISYEHNYLISKRMV